MNNSQLFEESQKYFPGGVNSPSHSFYTVGGNPLFIKSAKGSYLTDSENKNYIDVHSQGILGHQYPEIIEAIQQQLQNGFSLGTPSELQIELAETIIENIPNAEKIQFFSSESEACLNAIKLSRAFNGKSKILKFSGGYHGDSQSLLKDSGTGNSLSKSLDSKGIPKEISDLTLVSEFNNIEDLEDIFRFHSQEISAVIIEPVAANMGCIPAENLFLQKIRELCNENQTLLIFDETKTGFRLDFGGAQNVFTINADIIILGNIIGGNFPFGAVVSNEKIINQAAHYGDVFSEGLPIGNSLAFAAGIATLHFIKNNPDFYKNLNKKTEILDFEIGKILNSKNIAHRINRKGSMLSLFFHTHKVSNFQEALDSNVALYNNFFHFMLENGVFLPPNALKSWFVSDAMNDSEINKIIEIVGKFQYS